MNTTFPSVVGGLPRIIRNDDNLYEGNLKCYFEIIFFKARNLQHPYHNFGHMFHVMWLCYQACIFYKDILTPRRMRNLLIAAMFHDFNHSGMIGDDDLNIARAIRGLEKNIAKEDKDSLTEIKVLIALTEFPHKEIDPIPLEAEILRDADLSQALSVTWIQQVIFGLAEEWGQEPILVLQSQINFLKSLKYRTTWAKSSISESDLEKKMGEVREFLDLLDFPVTALG